MSTNDCFGYFPPPMQGSPAGIEQTCSRAGWCRMHALPNRWRGDAGDPGEYHCAELFRCTRASGVLHSPRTKTKPYPCCSVPSVGHVPPMQPEQHTDVVAVCMVPVPPFLVLKQHRQHTQLVHEGMSPDGTLWRTARSLRSQMKCSLHPSCL